MIPVTNSLRRGRETIAGTFIDRFFRRLDDLVASERSA